MTLPPEVGAEAEAAVPEAVLVGAGATEGRSLGQIAWMRLKRDKVALDLMHVTFVDRAAMEFLAAAKSSKIKIENVPSYVTRWIEQEVS